MEILNVAQSLVPRAEPFLLAIFPFEGFDIYAEEVIMDSAGFEVPITITEFRFLFSPSASRPFGFLSGTPNPVGAEGLSERRVPGFLHKVRNYNYVFTAAPPTGGTFLAFVGVLSA